MTLFPNFFVPITAKLGTTPLMLAVLIGAAQNILSKGDLFAFLLYTMSLSLSIPLHPSLPLSLSRSLSFSIYLSLFLSFAHSLSLSVFGSLYLSIPLSLSLPSSLTPDRGEYMPFLCKDQTENTWHLKGRVWVVKKTTGR